mgnify:CR=1 FL=1
MAACSKDLNNSLVEYIFNFPPKCYYSPEGDTIQLPLYHKSQIAFSPFLAEDLLGVVKTLWIAIGCRILIGVVAGWVWIGLRKLRLSPWVEYNYLYTTNPKKNILKNKLFMLY